MHHLLAVGLDVEPGSGITPEPRTGITLDSTTNIKNPFDGVIPRWDWLGEHFTQQWQLALGGFWALAIIASAFFLVKALMKLRHVKNAKMPQKAEAARGELMGTVAMTAGIIVVPAFFAFIINAMTGN